MSVPPEVQAFEPERLLSWALQQFGPNFAIVTSFQKEGMVLVDMASRLDPKEIGRAHV